MMGDMAGHMMVFLMNMAIKDRDVRMLQQNLGRLRTIGSRPIPPRVKIEQRPMGEYDDSRVRILLAQIVVQPLQLHIAQSGARIGDVVQDDKVNALVIKSVMGWTEKFLKRFALIQRAVTAATRNPSSTKRAICFLPPVKKSQRLASALNRLAYAERTRGVSRSGSTEKETNLKRIAWDYLEEKLEDSCTCVQSLIDGYMNCELDAAGDSETGCALSAPRATTSSVRMHSAYFNARADLQKTLAPRM
jgi:hypothetical protein